MVEIETEHLPPSTNHLYANVPGRGRVKSKRYVTWKNAAGWDMNGKGSVKGPYIMLITIDRKFRHKLSDLSNRVKALEDLLQEHGVIENDNLCEDLRVRWGDAGGKVRINIEEWKE